MSALPVLPYVDLRGEAGAISLLFGLAAGALFAVRPLLASSLNTNKTSGRRPRVPKAQLLTILAGAKQSVESGHAAALEAVARAAENRSVVPVAEMRSIIERRIAEADAGVFSTHAVTEKEASEALAYYASDPAVSAAVKAVVSAHPLTGGGMTPKKILHLQESIVDSEIEVYAYAVEAAKRHNIMLGSERFMALLNHALMEAGGKERGGAAGSGGGGITLAETVVTKAGFGDRAPLWTQIVSNAMVEESAEGRGDAFTKAYLGSMDRQKTALRALGLQVA
jgi:hypothetical protein